VLRSVVDFREPQVILFSEDIPRILEFYTKLGFTETFRVPAEGEPIHVDLILDGYKIGFASIDSARNDHGLSPSVEGQRATIALWTDDTAGTYAELVANGVTGVEAPHVWLDRLLIAWIADPDGNPIQIVQSQR
jgi:glyoxylase I family protein